MSEHEVFCLTSIEVSYVCAKTEPNDLAEPYIFSPDQIHLPTFPNIDTDTSTYHSLKPIYVNDGASPFLNNPYQNSLKSTSMTELKLIKT